MTTKQVTQGIFRRLRKYVVHPSFKFIAKFTPVYATVSEFRERSHSLGFNKGYKHYAKYMIFYWKIRRLRPRYVLECGSGCTTMVALAALKKNGAGTLVSLDESDYYGGVVRKIAKDMNLESNLEHHIVSTIDDVYKGVNGTRYTTVPEYGYDLIFIDGPQSKFNVDLDAFPILEKEPVPVIIDCRRATVEALRNFWPKKTRFRQWCNLGFVN